MISKIIDKQIKEESKRISEISEKLEKGDYQQGKMKAEYKNGFLALRGRKFLNNRDVVIQTDLKTASEIVEFIEYLNKNEVTN